METDSDNNKPTSSFVYIRITDIKMDTDPDRKKQKLKRADIVCPELSYQIVGALFDVYNALGDGHLEKTYQQAVAKSLEEKGLSFQEQVPSEVAFKGERVGTQYLDFLVEDSVILELKQGDRFRKQNFNQVIAYLKATNKPLAILANFTRDGVLFRRLINIPHS